MDLKMGRHSALITGASSGIGAGIAKVLAGEGIQVVMTARRADRLEQLAAEITKSGGVPPVVMAGDIANMNDLTRIVNESIECIGRIDILVNSAGGWRALPMEDAGAVWEEAFALNFTAPRLLTEAVLPAMRTRHWGRIINISGSMEPRSSNAATPAKAALHLWAKGLSCDVASDGVTINCIAPGRISSEQILNKLHPTEEARRAFIAGNIPAGYFGDPEDIGYLVAFLASPLARYITGAVIPVDGGMHFFAH